MTLDDALLRNALCWRGKCHLLRADAGRRVDRVYRRRWRRLLRSIRPGQPAPPVGKVLGPALEAETIAVARQFFQRVAVEAWEDTVGAVRSGAPDDVLRALAALYGVQEDEGDPDVKRLLRMPTAAEVWALVTKPFRGIRWTDKVARLDRTAAIATEIQAGLAVGESRNQIAERILPFVDQSRVAAMRIVRDEAHRVAVEAQMDATQRILGDFQVGWIHVTMRDDRVRPQHAVLDGRRLPIHPEPSDIPPLDYNCRCVLQAFTTANPPRPPTNYYGNWFDAQDADTQRDIVGARVFDHMAQFKGRVRWRNVIRALGLRRPPRVSAAQLRRMNADSTFLVP